MTMQLHGKFLYVALNISHFTVDLRNLIMSSYYI